MFGSIITPMVIDMNERQLNTVLQIRAFLNGTQEVRFEPIGEDSQRYEFIAAVSTVMPGPLSVSWARSA
jgi:hypothetical protein